MYRINLYREFFSRRRDARLKTARTALLAGLVGLELILVGVLVVSAALIREQAVSMRTEISQLSTRLGEGSRPRPGLESARQLLEVRANRVVWSPKLACLSDRIDRALVLQEVVGQVSERRPAELTVSGTIRGGSAQMEPVARFMEAMRNDPRIKDPFSSVRLGTLEGTESSKFQIICGAPKTEEAGS